MNWQSSWKTGLLLHTHRLLPVACVSITLVAIAHTFDNNMFACQWKRLSQSKLARSMASLGSFPSQLFKHGNCGLFYQCIFCIFPVHLLSSLFIADKLPINCLVLSLPVLSQDI